MPDEIPDEAVMQRVADGDGEAFSLLVRKYHVALLNFFHGMNVYSADRDDLVQETFIRLYNYRRKYRPTAKLKTFLYLLARQVQIDYFRKQQRRYALVETLRNEPREQFTRPGKHNMGDDRREKLQKALGALSEEMRCVVVMSIYQELKYAEIAEILDIPAGTVKTRMFHALQKLGKVIRNEE